MNLNYKRLKKFMIERHESKSRINRNRSTFEFQYDIEGDFVDVYVLGNIRIGSICRDVKEKLKMEGLLLVRKDEVELTIEIPDNMGGKVRDLCFAILTCASALVEAKDIKMDTGYHRMESLDCFFNFTKELAEEVTKESY